MADTPRTHAPRLVIPLFPDQPSARPHWLTLVGNFLARMRALIHTLSLGPERRDTMRAVAARLLAFIAPAILLAAGTATVLFLAAAIATAFGVQHMAPAATGAMAGTWTFLGTLAYGLLRAGWRLARIRWH
jgi:hypothetical protein